MKRVHVENWSTREKLALASSVLRSGDQNWMSVSRVIRTLGEPNRPPDWFSQKQCAVQYDLLLNNVGTQKRKKRNEKSGHDTSVDTPGETIVRKLTQERMEELKMLMSEYRALYLKEKRELEDVNLGKCDDRLNDIIVKLDYAEKHEDDEEAMYLRQWQEKKRKEAERTSLHLSTDHTHHAPVEVKPTSPLLTSLLQSPSPALLHRNSGPTISSLLHSAPSVPPVSPIRSSSSSSPTTLSKLLETPAMIQLSNSNDSDRPVTPINKPVTPTARSPVSTINLTTEAISRGNLSPRVANRIEQIQTTPPHNIQPHHSPIKQNFTPIKEHFVTKEFNKIDDKQELIDDLGVEDKVIKEILQEVEKTEAHIEADNVLDAVKVEVDDLTPVILDDAMEVVASMESEDGTVEVVVETAQHLIIDKMKNESQDDSSITGSDNVQNQTGESDVLEDQLDHLAELDSHAVEMIVVGPNQSAVISVHHDGSSENVEDEVSIETMPSNITDENVTVVSQSDDIQEEVVKEETIEIASSEIELAPEEKLEVIPDETIVITDNDNNDLSNNVKVDEDTVVKDLGVVSATEMKEIIEGAEVIVEDDSSHVVTDTVEVVESIDSTDNDSRDVNSDVVEVTTTTSSNDNDTIIETVVDSVIEVGSTVDNVVPFNSIESTVIELGEAETSITGTCIATTAHTSSSSSITVEQVQSGKKYFDDDDDDHLPEPDSSSCSIDDIDSQSIVDTTSNKVNGDNEASKSDVTLNKEKDKVDMSMDVNQVTVLSSSASSSPSPTPPIVMPIASVSGSNPINMDVVTSSSRPDTPSTEEDNEPVANLVKKLPRKLSDSVPNSPVSNTTEDGASLRAWKKSIMLVYNRLATHKFASLFLKPITDEQAHGYHSVIHRPMDLSTIKKNIESGVLRTTVEFQRDMLLMFQNAIMYNNSTTLVYERASEMQKECIQHMQLMVEAMGEGVPLRRETLVVDKLTRQRVGIKQETVDVTPKRKRTQVLTNSGAESSGGKRRKTEEP